MKDRTLVPLFLVCLCLALVALLAAGCPDASTGPGPTVAPTTSHEPLTAIDSPNASPSTPSSATSFCVSEYALPSCSNTYTAPLLFSAKSRLRPVALTKI